MDFEYSEKEQAFRDEVRAFIKANLPPPKERNSAFFANWLTKVREKRWVGFSWPKDAGGGEGTLAEQAILREEMALAKAPPLGTSFMGLAWVGPGIIQYGTPAQKQRFIPGILDSSVSWCTGYSEPNHGSDLASIQTKAIRQGRPLRRQRPEDLDDRRAVGRLDDPAGTYRFRTESEARRHHVPARRHEIAGRRSTADRKHGG